jgi:hypothetical protein
MPRGAALPNLLDDDSRDDYTEIPNDDNCRQFHCAILLQAFDDATGGASYPVESLACRIWYRAAKQIDDSARMILNRVEQGDSALDEAKDFLIAALEGGAVKVTELKTQAEARSISWASIRRAQEQLRITPSKVAMKNGWSWKLPGTGA